MSEKMKEFIKNHPFVSYLLASTITGKICRMVVDVVRGITGKYPPAPNFNWSVKDPFEADDLMNVKPEEVDETEETPEETDVDTE